MARSDVLSSPMLAELKRLAIECRPQIRGQFGEFFVMGAGELREAFNSVSQPVLTCTLALLDYERTTDPDTKRTKESQILLFRGNAADGTPFEIKSEPLKGGVDLNLEAKAVAQKLLDQRKPAP